MWTGGSRSLAPPEDSLLCIWLIQGRIAPESPQTRIDTPTMSNNNTPTTAEGSTASSSAPEPPRTRTHRDERDFTNSNTVRGVIQVLEDGRVRSDQRIDDMMMEVRTTLTQLTSMLLAQQQQLAGFIQGNQPRLSPEPVPEGRPRSETRNPSVARARTVDPRETPEPI